MSSDTVDWIELRESIRGQVLIRDVDPSFADFSTIFNGNVITTAKAVACPLDAEDVSGIITFCAKYGLSPSAKAGGYGTAGWAVGGDVIIDLHMLTDVDIETPRDNEDSYTSLRDMLPANSKGKKAALPPVIPNPGKRRREEDAVLRVYDDASPAVATFLQSDLSSIPGLADTPQADNDGDERPVRNVRRRLDPSAASASDPEATHQYAPELATVTEAAVVNTLSFSPSELHSREENRRDGRSTTDPFGYLDTGVESSAAAPSIPPTFTQGSGSTSTGPVANPRAAPQLPAQINPSYRIAYVTFGAGKRQKEVDMYTASHPLEGKSATGTLEKVPYHIPFAAHPAGSSIMIQGGFGFLSRMHGLSIDNLVEVEMVLADGSIVIVNEKDYPDLWWALRGAGPAFGIATRYKAKAFPVPIVFGGNLIYRFNKATAPSLLKHFRDCIKGAPRELYANAILTAGPKGKDSLVIIQMCYVGPKQKGQEFLSAISSWDGEQCLLNEVDEKNFLHQQDSVAQVLRGKPGRQWFIRSALIHSLPDDIVNRTVLKFSETPVGCTWLFELAGGAIGDYEDSCFPKQQREASFTIAALHQWEMGVNDPRCRASAEEWIFDIMRSVLVGGAFPSFLGRHEPPERTMSCYGENWKRLCEIKNRYDPMNIFKNCLWPLDAKGQPVEPAVREPQSPSQDVQSLPDA